MLGFIKKLFGKGDDPNSSAQAAAAVGQTPATPGATAAVPGAVDQVGVLPSAPPVAAPVATVETATPSVEKPA